MKDNRWSLWRKITPVQSQAGKRIGLTGRVRTGMRSGSYVPWSCTRQAPDGAGRVADASRTEREPTEARKWQS